MCARKVCCQEFVIKHFVITATWQMYKFCPTTTWRKQPWGSSAWKLFGNCRLDWFLSSLDSYGTRSVCVNCASIYRLKLSRSDPVRFTTRWFTPWSCHGERADIPGHLTVPSIQACGDLIPRPFHRIVMQERLRVQAGIEINKLWVATAGSSFS